MHIRIWSWVILTSPNGEDYVFTCVHWFIWTLATLRKNGWTDFHEIVRIGGFGTFCDILGMCRLILYIKGASVSVSKIIEIEERVFINTHDLNPPVPTNELFSAQWFEISIAVYNIPRNLISIDFCVLPIVHIRNANYRFFKISCWVRAR